MNNKFFKHIFPDLVFSVTGGLLLYLFEFIQAYTSLLSRDISLSEAFGLTILASGVGVVFELVKCKTAKSALFRFVLIHAINLLLSFTVGVFLHNIVVKPKLNNVSEGNVTGMLIVVHSFIIFFIMALALLMFAVAKIENAKKICDFNGELE